MTHRVPIGLRGFAAAEVAERPGGVSQHAELAAVAEQRQERAQRALLEHEVAADGAVAGNVAEGPDGLLSHVRLMAA